MVAPRSPRGCQKITDWPTPIFGSHNLHYLLFSGIRALLCHHPYCFSSQSQTLFVIGVGRPKVTAAARWLFRRENTFDFPGGRDGGRGWRRCFKHFFGIQIFSRLVKVFIRILQPFFLPLGFIYLFFWPLEFFSRYSFSRYSVTRYSLLRQLCLVTPLKKDENVGPNFYKF